MARALQLTLKLCEFLSIVHLNRQSFSTDYIVMTERTNVQRLHPPSVVGKDIDLSSHPNYIKQHSEEWHELRYQCKITGSTAYNALGFRGMKELKAHFNEFVYDRGPREFTPEVQQRLDHGSKHEVFFMLL